MADLYGRSYNLVVGPVGKQGLLIKDLRISFKIEKDLEKKPNAGSVNILNLSEKSRSIIEEKNSAIILNAGFGENPKSIFVADIAKIVTVKQGNDIVTQIECGDGEAAYSNKNVNLSFGAGAKFGDVLNSVISSFGLIKGDVQGVNEADQFQNGISMSGLAKDALTDLTAKQGLDWSIQDGQLQILPPDTPTKEQAILISPSTGLVGSPNKTKILNQQLLKDKANSGVKLICLLNPEIKPGRRIKVESKFVNGIFKVEKVTHSGDSHGKQWFTELEAV